MPPAKPSPRSVLVVASEYPPTTGGLQTLARSIVRGLAPSMRVHLVVQQGQPRPAPEGEASVAFLDFRGNVEKKKRREHRDDVLGLAAKTNADVVHFLNAGFACVVGERWDEAGPPAVVHVAGKDFTSPWIRLGFAADKARVEMVTGLNAAAAVVAISEFTRGALVAGGVTRSIDRIEPGVEAVPIPTASAILPIDRTSADPLVLCVARHERRKGQHLLLEAVAQARARAPRLRLVITSDGPERARLEARARELALGDAVVFAGRVDADVLAALYRAADVFCLTPIVVRDGDRDDFEGFGIVYSEAASVGVPSIASRSGGACEAVIDGETGIVVPENDVGALAAALVELARNRALRMSLGAAAKARFEREGTVTTMIERIRAVYARLLSAVR
jgi:phosphatidyl-myo-inositol dimannoside synthase